MNRLNLAIRCAVCSVYFWCAYISRDQAVKWGNCGDPQKNVLYLKSVQSTFINILSVPKE